MTRALRVHTKYFRLQTVTCRWHMHISWDAQSGLIGTYLKKGKKTDHDLIRCIRRLKQTSILICLIFFFSNSLLFSLLNPFDALLSSALISGAGKPDINQVLFVDTACSLKLESRLILVAPLTSCTATTTSPCSNILGVHAQAPCQESHVSSFHCSCLN